MKPKQTLEKTMRRHSLRIAVSALALSFAALAWAEEAVPLSVKLKGDRPSLLFTEKECVKIKARVEGGSGPGALEYAAKETCGEWSCKGSVEIPRAGAETLELEIPLAFPGRGHYKLEAVARCGASTAKDSTAVAVIYEPLQARADSPWGIMYGGYRGVPGTKEEDAPAQIAENMRMLGASWTRLTLWKGMYGIKVEGGEVKLELSKLRRQVEEFRKRGINILAEFVMTPQILSSKPDSSEESVDAGPLYGRVKPADYRLWDQMVERIAREFKDEIQIWEIWNEADIKNQYWSGTVEEFIELVEHTTAAIRRGSPSAKIASAGFTPNTKTCKPFFDAGFGKGIDILSVHYTDRADYIGEFLKLQERHGLQLPMTVSEESAIIPLNNLARGARSFKFLHVTDSYDASIPLMRADWKATPAGVTQSVGARLIGSKKLKRIKQLPGFKAYFFGDGGELAAIRASDDLSTPKLLRIADKVLVKATPREGGAVSGIDALGRERELKGGTGEIPFSFMGSVFKESSRELFASPECVFVSGCEDISSVEALSSGSIATVVEAEDGDFDRETMKVAASDRGFSEGRYIDIFREEPPTGKGYRVDIKVTAPRDGLYKVFFSGNNLGRLADKPVSISPFVWSFDGMKESAPDGKTVKVTGGVPGAPEGLSELGTVRLSAGEHVFHLRLTAPRATDKRWALWFDAIALVPVQD